MLLAFSLQLNDLLGLAATLNKLLGSLLPANLLSLPGIGLPGLGSLGSTLDSLGTSLNLPGITNAINGAGGSLPGLGL
jgi:hypothetical protein